MVITAEQNTEANGYGITPPLNPPAQKLKLWSDFYGVALPTYQEAEQRGSPHYIAIGDIYLNAAVYKKRLRQCVEPFLCDANERAKEKGKKAYVHVSHLGLKEAILEKAPHVQAQLIAEVYAEILGENYFPHISDIDFSKFPPACQQELERLKKDNAHCRFHISKRLPAAKLRGEDEGKLLVAMYLESANAYPGNSYWQADFIQSPSAAVICCSTLAQLHNPEINPNVCSAQLVCR
jgi:hypothetical protein